MMVRKKKKKKHGDTYTPIRVCLEEILIFCSFFTVLGLCGVHEMRKCTAILLCCERYKTKRECGWPARYTMLCMFSLHVHVTTENGSYIISETIDWRKVYLILVVFVVILCMYVYCRCVFLFI